MTIWHIKALCHQTHGMSVGDFIKMMEKEFKHVTDFQSELDLEPERKLLEMAKRYQLQFDPVPKAKKHPKMKETTEEGDEKSAVDSAPPVVEEDPRALTLDDAEIIIERGSTKMPFIVEKKWVETLKKEIEKYKKDYKGDAQKLFKKVPKIEAYDEMLENMKKDL